MLKCPECKQSVHTGPISAYKGKTFHRLCLNTKLRRENIELVAKHVVNVERALAALRKVSEKLRRPKTGL